MQTFALMKKWSTMYWRSPAYNLTRFLMTTLIALFYGTMYLQKGHLPKSGMGYPARHTHCQALSPHGTHARIFFCCRDATIHNLHVANSNLLCLLVAQHQM